MTGDARIGRGPGASAPAGKLASHARGPGHLWHKLLLVARRRRAMPGYRRALAAGELVWEPPAEPAQGLISVAMPVFRVSEEHLRAAIESVEAQTFQGWELVAVDDASPEPHVRRVLEEAARRDARIRVVQRSGNAGIAVASDEAAAMARGSHVAFLDHDDVLHPRALELIARHLAWKPDTDYLFTDEDKLDARGRHVEPCLKPGWSRHLLLATNYVSHLRVIRAELLLRLGGHREGLEGAQDWDLALRAVAAGARLAHLPGVLYHWRATPRSMALAAGAKPAANANASRALLQHARGFLAGRQATVEALLPSASLFALSWQPLRPLTAEVLPDGLEGEALEDAAARAQAPVVVSAPRRLPVEAFEALLARLEVPGTAVVAGRLVRGRRVAGSGWAATADGRLVDPLRGQAASSPGYYNWALATTPRLVPPSCGWVARREALVEAWQAAPDAPPSWRLWLGLARMGLEVVSAPVHLPAGPGAGAPDQGLPPGVAPPWQWSAWVDRLRLC